MTWAELHQKSERLAAEAQVAARTSPDAAQNLYIEAAKLEAEALDALAPSKQRTLGITVVGHDLSLLSSHDVFRRVLQFNGGDRRISGWPARKNLERPSGGLRV